MGIMRTLWLCLLAVVFGACLPLHAQPQSADVPTLVDMLSHPASGYRTRAATALDSLGASSAPALAHELRTAPLGRASRAAVVLRKMERRASVAAPEILALLGTPCEDWRWNVGVQVLGKISPESYKEALPHLIAGLEAGALRQHASLNALQVLKADAAGAAPALLALLARPRPPLQGVVLDDSVVNNRTIAWTAAARPYDDLVILETLMAVGASQEPFIPTLQAMTRSPMPSVRLDVASWLLRNGTADGRRWAVPSLIPLLDEDRAGLREAAVKLLAMAGPDASLATPALTRLLLRPEGAIRRESAIALGQIGPGAAASLPLLKKTAAMQRLLDPGSAKDYTDAVAKIETANRNP
jgi:HEAT repeat protein